MLVVLGLIVLLAALIVGLAGAPAVQGRTARRELSQSHRQTAAISQERDDLVDQRQAERSDQPWDT